MPRDGSRSKVRKKIVNAAWQLFYEKGYSATTVDDIIALSGTSKGSFYYYFNAKQELLNTLSVILDGYYDELEGQMSEELNSYEKLRFLNREMHKWMGEKIGRELLTSLYSTQLSSEDPSCLIDKNRSYFAIHLKIIEDGQKKGELTTKMSASEMMRYFSMCERALITDWCLHRGDDCSLEDYSDRYMELMLQGIRG